MARIELAPEVLDDFDRFLEHLGQFGSSETAQRVAQISDALQILDHNPMIGRPVRGGMRELVVGVRTRGHVALYQFVAEMDTVIVLAVRSQRESGYGERR